LASYVSERRASAASATINGDLEYLRRVLNRARDIGGYRTPTIRWKIHWLKERQRERVLSSPEEAAFFEKLRPDAHAIIRFDLRAGVRIGNAVGLKWTDIKDDHIEIRMKGDELLSVPITEEIAEILAGEKGRHDTYVFTYVAQTIQFRPHTGERRVKGRRYPFTRFGLWRLVTRALSDIGLWDGRNLPDGFRIHDFRHTAATRMLRATGNLKTTQKFLGHKDIRTTIRYLHTLVDDVRAGMEAVQAKAQSRHRSRDQIQ